MIYDGRKCFVSIELVIVFFQFSFHLVRDCVLGILIYC